MAEARFARIPRGPATAVGYLGVCGPGYDLAPPLPRRGVGAPAAPVDVLPLRVRRDMRRRVDQLVGHDLVVRVQGEWNGRALLVQGMSRDRLRGSASPKWRQPPCAPPAGGWPRTGRVDCLVVDVADLRASGSLVCTTLFRPSPEHAVLVAAATDVETVTRVLRGQCGGSVCVVPSTYSRREIDEQKQRFASTANEWTTYSIGESSNANGQPVISAFVDMTCPALRRFTAPRPDLFDLDYWITPDART